nr:hypothetical protein [Propionivibrio sp.]
MRGKHRVIAGFYAAKINDSAIWVGDFQMPKDQFANILGINAVRVKRHLPPQQTQEWQHFSRETICRQSCLFWALCAKAFDKAALTEKGCHGIRQDKTKLVTPQKYPLSADQFAALNQVVAQSVRARLCRTGSYFGVRPVKLANGRLAFPNVQVTK